MKVDLALLADYAEVTQRGGKLVICGIFDRIGLPDLEAVHPHMALALRLSVEAGEEPSHDLQIRLVDPDGADVIAPMQARVDVEAGTEPETSVNLILDLNLIKFGCYGPHSFDIFLDDRFEHRIPLTVERTPAANP